MSGADRVEFLHKYCTQEVRVEPGRGVYGCILTIKGAMLGDLWVLVRDDDMLVVTPPAATEGLFKHLSRYALFDKVDLTDVSSERVVISVWGPTAQAALAAIGAPSPSGDAQLDHCTAQWEGSELVVARNDFAGLPGWDLIVLREGAVTLLNALADADAKPVCDAVVEQLRVEAGVPLYGSDLGESTIPLEAGLEERAISFDKGCYMGQEVIARISHRGRPARHLCGLRFPAGTLADSVSLPVPLLVGDKEVGQLTSCVHSPRLDALVGLATVRRKHVEPGTELQAGNQGPLGTVCELPFG
jgi:folate-binding protein YgfZ